MRNYNVLGRERSVPLRVGGSIDPDDRRSASGCQMQRSGVAPDKELRPLEKSDKLKQRGWKIDRRRSTACAPKPVHKRLFTRSPGQNARQAGFLPKPVMQERVIFRSPVLGVPATTRIQDDKIADLA